MSSPFAFANINTNEYFIKFLLFSFIFKKLMESDPTIPTPSGTRLTSYKQVLPHLSHLGLLLLVQIVES